MKRHPTVPADQEDRIAKVEEGEVIWTGTDRTPHGPTNTTVGPKCDQNKGRWWCTTHSQSFNNNLQKDIHIESNKHRLAWMCFEHGLETP